MVGGEQASPVLFKNHSSLRQVLVDGKHWHGGLLIPKRFVEERLGVDFAENEIEALLKMLNLSLTDGNKYGEAGVMVYSPFWRTDIELPEDIVRKLGDYTALINCRVICQSEASSLRRRMSVVN